MHFLLLLFSEKVTGEKKKNVTEKHDARCGGLHCSLLDYSSHQNRQDKDIFFFFADDILKEATLQNALMDNFLDNNGP